MHPLARRPLRVQLTVFMVVLLGLGLLATSLLATAALRGYLIDRVDQELAGASRPFTQVRLPGGDIFGGQARPTSQPAGVSGSTSSPDSTSVPSPPNRFYVAIVRDDVTAELTTISTPTSGTSPALPEVGELSGHAGQPFEVASTNGDATWRVLVTPLADGAGLAVIALPLADVEGTVSRLVFLQLIIVGLTALVVTGIVVYLVVRRSLRPLDEVVAAAHEIADGDLTRRVPDMRTSREVEELATSFNTMITRIEGAFAAQRASETQARQSEDRMRRFVADASHELRTPLTSIRGYAELIEEGAATDPAQALDRIQAEADRMGSLVDDLLQQARMDEQRPLDRAPVSVAEVVRAGVEATRVANPGREVLLSAPDDGPWILGDEQRLRQVVDNLLSNAVRYSPDDEPIDVRVATAAAGGGRTAEVRVTDRGPGLAAGEAEHVFERLYRTDDARSRVSGGSGLGLSIVRSIVAAHGGDVFVESAPGEGATFGFTIPLP